MSKNNNDGQAVAIARPDQEKQKIVTWNENMAKKGKKSLRNGSKMPRQCCDTTPTIFYDLATGFQLKLDLS